MPPAEYEARYSAGRDGLTHINRLPTLSFLEMVGGTIVDDAPAISWL